MTKPDFGKALREADGELREAGMAPDVDRRLHARLARETERTAPRAWAPRWAMGAVAAGVLLALGLALRLAPSASEETLGGLRLLSSSPDFHAAVVDGDKVVVTRGACVLAEGRGATLSLEGTAELRQVARGVEVLRGRVAVAVRPREAGEAAYRVEVSHASIVVLGTHFVVDQDAAGGQVHLIEGSIQLEHRDGGVERLRPGQRASWPRPGAPPTHPAPPPTPSEEPLPDNPPPAPPVRPRSRPAAPIPSVRAAPEPPPVPALTPEPPPSAPSALQIEVARADELLETVAALRSRGRYRDAVERLTHALGENLSGATRERLSFELGAITTWQLGDRAAACAHWARHLAEHGEGRYGRALETARGHRGCDR